MDQQSNTPDRALELFIVLSRAHQWVVAHAQRDIRRHGLNITEFGVLEVLYHKGELPLQQIGEKVLMTSGNITYVVDKLERKGLVRRKMCESDRRVIFAEVTEQGRDLIHAVFPSHAEVIRNAVSGLTDEEQQLIIPLLKKLGIAAQKSLP
ncbi:MarR family winged helix-turn-helix transcriptional regulator [Paenibacillus sp. GCM10027626]|uniref:MarR family winged helix-turn-helix transcriptional regulator n=1 Tax=Paenibacillus sp. GCM10027626 TaxID=3273411 RepID=UPI00362FFD4A